MNKYGLVLNEVGMEGMFDSLQVEDTSEAQGWQCVAQGWQRVAQGRQCVAQGRQDACVRTC